ncbi:MAG: DUF4428 domain-containing protein [Clostridia bacterium]|nr:DUF4428 domain-containing protein [Clostridia bacterium]
MALFGLFDKKSCAICGNDIGMLGNRKLEDGNMCKNCASLLSPFFSERRQSSVAEIQEQLAWRRNNFAELANIHPTRVFGTNMKVYIDDNAGKFFLSRSRNWREENPDLIPLNRVIDCAPSVQEHRTEVYHRGPDGRNVSYNPPRYRYTYEFDIQLHVDMPWFTEIRFELTDARPERQGSQEYRDWENQALELVNALTAAPAAIQVETPIVDPTLSTANIEDQWTCSCGQVNAGKFCVSCGAAKPEAPAETAPVSNEDSWVCECGQTNTGKFCPNCGKPRPEKPKLFRCDKCGWTPEDPANPPKFCPNCGDPFNESDLA